MTPLDTICSKILTFIDERNNFLVTAHLNADGDAYGAVLAIAYLLESKGKAWEIVLHDQEKDDKYRYLWGWDQIVSYAAEAPARHQAAIVVDVPSRARIGDSAALLPAPEDCLKIDHHPVEEEFAALSYVDVAASSTCQMVYEIVSRSTVTIDTHLANALFCGIMYDTGRFSFANTRSRDFEIAAHLCQQGVSSNIVATNLFFNHTFAALSIVGYGLANMKSYLNGQVCVILLPLAVMVAARGEDVDELANYSLAIRDVEVGLYVRHVEPHFTKISFRSKGKVDVNKVARKFGGGGHVHAAGCRMQAPPESFLDDIIAEIQRQLEAHRAGTGQ